MEDFHIRLIRKNDSAALAAIIRNTLEEFGANYAGTVYYDSSTDHLYELFQRKISIYFVAEDEHQILGGAGIYPTEGLPENTCELVKMYLLPVARGKGLGQELIARCLQFAGEAGYQQVYLETMPELTKAMKVYEKFGFSYLNGPLGNSGHFGCAVWMLKHL